MSPDIVSDAFQDASPMETTGICLHRKAKANEDKIFVTVRFRPLNLKEQARNDFCVWERSDDTTVTCIHDVRDRTSVQPTYTFDQVFGTEATTEEVYKKGAKEVALSALKGKNATIFAYGQTCSGKTYTMQGIAENAAEDIFSCIKQHEDRTFLLKFSALEIYNEVLNDLLNPEGSPLRLLDDPERGTIIERLVEEVVQDIDHLYNLLALCQARRQVGETCLNDVSSRSHQIIRLTIESSSRMIAADDGSPLKSLVAILNFVDLAGSERASLAQSEGIRLKEGFHINRSLLTLSSVIRKLSDSNRAKGGHIPYRDSKLTRILQNSLGGNARTAIICTMSTSNRHVEQSRNTLLFATCAKEVTNAAQVNMVVSDKVLIKQLKKEVASLEAKLQYSSEYASPVDSPQSSSNALLLEKDLQIQKMKDEMHEALQQRDLAQSQLNDVLKQMETVEQAKALALCQIDTVDTTSSTPLSSIADDQIFHRHSNDVVIENEMDLTWKQDMVGVKCVKDVTEEPLETIRTQTLERQASSASTVLLKEIHKLEHLQYDLAKDAKRALTAVQKEVECLSLEQTGMNQEGAEHVSRLQAELRELYESGASEASVEYPVIKDFISEEKPGATVFMDDIQRTVCENKEKYGNVNNPMTDFEKSTSSNSHISTEELAWQTQSPQSAGAPLIVENAIDAKCRNDMGRVDSRRNSKEEIRSRRQRLYTKMNSVINENGARQAEENIRNISAYVTALKGRLAKLQCQKQLLVDRIIELEKNGNTEDFDYKTPPASPARWKSDFHVKRKEIFKLWDAYHVSIIHRAQFFTLLRGDPADAIYLEIELRRLKWLRTQHAELGMKSAGLVREEQAPTLAASERALKREREWLAKCMRTQWTESEREQIYGQWDIPLNAKQRKIKLAFKIWSDPGEEQHIRRSAELVARLVGAAPQPIFDLAFPPYFYHGRTWWNSISHLLGT